MWSTPGAGASGLSRASRQQYSLLVILALLALGCTALLSRTHGSVFQPYFPGLPPLVAMGVIAVVAVVALRSLLARGFHIWARANDLRETTIAAGGATLFVLPTIVVDMAVGFPKEINVPWPQSIFFYPAMGFVAETIFHAAPLAILLAALSRLAPRTTPAAAAWVSIGLVAAAEPVFQATLGAAQGQNPWLVTYVGVQLYAFNLFQLWLFRRDDFLRMYLCRLVYYLIWHVLWGYLRLG